VTKGPQAFRTISEASEELGVPQHVLRFWETKFSFIRPMKRAGGRRFYRPQDLAVLKGVRALLHEDGYTIKGVQRLHKEQGVKRLLAAAGGEEAIDIDAYEADLAAREPEPLPQFTAEADAPLGDEAEQGLLDALDALEAARARLGRILPGG
jgi:DNA-binding transcriptional MerR regulator